MPPLIIGEKEVDEAVAILERVLTKLGTGEVAPAGQSEAQRGRE